MLRPKCHFVRNKVVGEKVNYNKSKLLSHLVKGQNVMLKKETHLYWSHGRLKAQCQQPRFYIVENENSNSYRKKP